MADTQQTLVLLKPDSLQRGLAGRIISRLEQTGLKIVAMKMLQVDKDLAYRHYGIHQGKPFFDELTTFMSSGPCFPMALEREEAVEVFRTLIGATDPAQANTGTLRKDFATSVGENAVHGSDSDENAQKEVAFFFTPEDILGHL